jgi:DinB superfamily
MTPVLASSRPDPSEYAPYYEKYISLVPSGDIVSVLESLLDSSQALLRSVTEELGDHAYAPGKWSLKEVLGHLSDSERIFGYRILRISRNDQTPIEGFEQDDYVRNGPFRNCKLADLAEDFAVVRRSTLRLLRNLADQAWLRRGVANKNEVSVRALAYITAGHELHHIAIVRDKYLRQPISSRGSSTTLAG